MRWLHEGGIGSPRGQRGLARDKVLLISLLVVAIAGLVWCCWFDKDDGDESGPSSKYVKFKNRGGTGQKVKAGMEIDWSQSSDGSTKDGVVKHGFAEILDGNDATGGMNVTVPPFAKSYVFNFELQDGTGFVNAPCICPMVFGGLDIRMVTAELKSEQQGGQTLYWLEFDIEYDDYYDWPSYPPASGTTTGIATDKVPAGTVKTWP